MAMRFVGIFLLLLLLLEPILTALDEEEYPPLVVLLQDDSESMVAHKDSTYMRKQYGADYDKLVKELEDKGARVQTYAFGNEVRKTRGLDSVFFRQSGTDIGAALEQISAQYANQNLAGIILLSDGISTGGRSPRRAAENLKAPIHTVLVGDTIRPRDLMIEAVLYNEISYKDTETPIQVNLRMHGYASAAIEVSLYQNGNRIASSNALLTAANNTAQADFSVVLKNTGVQTFDVVINRRDDEISHLNNQQRIFLNVLENRFSIAIIAGGPHPDLGALNKTFSSQKQYKVDEYVRESAASFYQAPGDLSKYDLIVLHNFPNSANDRAVLDKVFAEVDSRKVPLIHFVGSQTRMNIHPRQTEYMGLAPTRTANSVSESFMYTDVGYRSHSTFRFDDVNEFNYWLQTAPPILRNDGDWKPQPGTTIIGKAKLKGIALDYPIMALQEHNGHKTITFLGENIWRWRMHDYVQHESFDLFDGWMQNLADWLNTRNDRRRFRVYPLKRVFSGDERAILKGEVYDDSNKPVKGAEVKVTVADEKGTKTDYFLTEEQPGNYVLALGNLAEGTYKYNATGQRDGKALGTDAGEFSLGRSAIEYRDLKANAPLLQQLSKQTGGLYSELKQLGTLPDRIEATKTLLSTSELQRNTRSLQQFLWPLLLAIALLTAEWVLRKRSGLV